MSHMGITDDVRARVLHTLDAKDRDLAWMARVVGKSKAWATDFKQGRGTLSHADMRQLAAALGVAESYLWDGVSENVSTNHTTGIYTAELSGGITPPAEPPAAGGQRMPEPLDGLRWKLAQLPADQIAAAVDALEECFRLFRRGGVTKTGHLPHVAKHKR